MKHFILDGNNLIGKIPTISSLDRTDKQGSRIKLAHLLGRYFARNKNKVTLHFDGHMNEEIKVAGIKIRYSGNHTADDQIKKEIEKSKNPRNVIVISSDNNIVEFARVCSCDVIRSEDFAKKVFADNNFDEEQSIIDELKNSDEFKKLFGVK